MKCIPEESNPGILERETGVEPATSSLGSWHSTTELLPLCRKNNSSLGEFADLYPALRLRGRQSFGSVPARKNTV
jgi:hypothetical protein